ncbi:MAG: hypothetical protein JSR86_22150 [Proteobacteria bacterium]|nr:hypothetical protein [Pseudomonadota bacterium]
MLPAAVGVAGAIAVALMSFSRSIVRNETHSLGYAMASPGAQTLRAELKADYPDASRQIEATLADKAQPDEARAAQVRMLLQPLQTHAAAQVSDKLAVDFLTNEMTRLREAQAVSARACYLAMFSRPTVSASPAADEQTLVLWSQALREAVRNTTARAKMTYAERSDLRASVAPYLAAEERSLVEPLLAGSGTATTEPQMAAACHWQALTLEKVLKRGPEAAGKYFRDQFGRSRD